VHRIGAKVLLTVPHSRSPAIAGAGNQRLINQAVVLQEAHEHAGQHPGDGGLRDLAVAPLLERHCRPLSRDRLVMLSLQVRGDIWRRERAFTDRILERGDERLECRE
jgi:hypothetical protein